MLGRYRLFLLGIALVFASCSGGNDSSGDDQDSDGYKTTQDCDDNNANVHPDAVEIAYDGVDQDCDGFDLVDQDGDGYPALDAGGKDCDDFNKEINPSAEDVAYDGVDQDCDGADLVDADGDGYVGEEANGDDCGDDDPLVYPDAIEIPYDRTDQDCDGEDLADLDGDGYIARVSGGEDCDDRDPDINPDAEENCDDPSTDRNCDGSTALNDERCFLYPDEGAWRSSDGTVEFQVNSGGEWMDISKAYMGSCTNDSSGCTADADLEDTYTVEIFNSYGQASFYLGTAHGDNCWGTFDTEDTARGTCSSYSETCDCSMIHEWSATLGG